MGAPPLICLSPKPGVGGCAWKGTWGWADSCGCRTPSRKALQRTYIQSLPLSRFILCPAQGPGDWEYSLSPRLGTLVAVVPGPGLSVVFIPRQLASQGSLPALAPGDPPPQLRVQILSRPPFVLEGKAQSVSLSLTSPESGCARV